MVGALGLGTAPWGRARGMETLRVCTTIKESRQGINPAFPPLVDAAAAAGLTLDPDSMFLFPCPENEFRGELLNQRWTRGEKISSCEGAAGLHGTRIKVSAPTQTFLGQ